MAKKNQNVRGAANKLLESLGVRGNLQDLVRRAVIQGWDVNEFADALIRTKSFRRAYPGLVQGGAIHVDFGGGAGAQSLITAVGNYNRGLDDFKALASRMGARDVSKRVFGLAVRNDISLDEYGARLQVEKTIQANPGLLDQFNEQLKLTGKNPLDEMGWRKFLVKAKGADYYDAYEAAFLRAQGLDLSAEQAAGVAKSIGTPGAGGTDLNQLVQEINRIKTDVAPELGRAGITDADLALLASGSDPGGKAAQLEQIVARRRALQQRSGGSSGQTSSTGGFSLFSEDEAAAY